MSGLELNKIVASILIASLLAMIVGVVSNVLYKPKLEVAQRGYQIDVADGGDSAGGADPEEASGPLDIKALMASANAESGAKIIKKCVSCHSFDKGGANKIGPNLWKVVGAAKGKKDGFAYSKAMASAGGSWNYENLFGFLAKPSKYMPGTKMAFVGLRKPEDIADVIAYLEQ